MVPLSPNYFSGNSCHFKITSYISLLNQNEKNNGQVYLNLQVIVYFSVLCCRASKGELLASPCLLMAMVMTGIQCARRL